MFVGLLLVMVMKAFTIGLTSPLSAAWSSKYNTVNSVYWCTRATDYCTIIFIDKYNEI